MLSILDNKIILQLRVYLHVAPLCVPRDHLLALLDLALKWWIEVRSLCRFFVGIYVTMFLEQSCGAVNFAKITWLQIAPYQISI